MLTDPPVVNAGATVLYSQQPSDLIKWYLSLADGKEVYWVFAKHFPPNFYNKCILFQLHKHLQWLLYAT